jgi:hypothetical protein
MGRDGMGCHATGRDAMGWDATGKGWYGTGRHVMGRDGMGRNGMALSHSNAWPGTASLFIKSSSGLCSKPGGSSRQLSACLRLFLMFSHLYFTSKVAS